MHREVAVAVGRQIMVQWKSYFGSADLGEQVAFVPSLPTTTFAFPTFTQFSPKVIQFSYDEAFIKRVCVLMMVMMMRMMTKMVILIMIKT